jgi:hypothetical protein
MRIDLAQGVKIGDTIYNCFMDKLVVSSISKKVGDDGKFHSIVFGTVDTRLHNANYDPVDVYFEDLYGESDDEKSWVEWAKNNRDFFAEFDHIETMKEIYKTGFCRGFDYKKQLTYEEMMQK